LFTIIPAPYFRKFSKNRSIKAFVDGVTAAATGSIAGAAFVLGRRALIDIPTILIALVTVGVLLKFKKTQEPLLIAAAGVVGVVLRGILVP
jgi:chromate transporter